MAGTSRRLWIEAKRKMMDLNAKWEAVKDHYEQAYKIKFSEKPNETVINHLYSEYSKFTHFFSDYCKVNPEAEKRTMRTSNLKILSKTSLLSVESDDIGHSNELSDDCPPAA